MDPVGNPEVEEQEEEDGGVGLPVLMVGAVALGVMGASCLAGGFVVLQPMLFGPGASDYAVVVNTLEPGDKITAGDVEFTKGLVVPGAVHDPEKLVGRVAASAIYAGDPVVERRLAPEGRPAGTAALAPEGMRAIWFKADSGISGLGLGVGDLVDLWTIGRAVEDTELLAEKVQVLAIERRAVSGDKVTLAAEPEIVEAIGKAREKAVPLGMTLRSAQDRAVEAVGGEALDAAAAEAGVVHAIHPLAAGKPITAADLMLLPDSGKGKAQFTAIDDVVGRVPLRAVYPGERPIEAVLSKPEDGRGLSVVIDPAERGVSLSLAGGSLADFPIGTRVDVFGLVDDGVAEIIGEGLEVIGQQKAGEGCPCITMRIPEEAAGAVLLHRVSNTLGLRLPEGEE